MIYVANGVTKLSLRVYSGGRLIGSTALRPGYNRYTANGAGPGRVTVQVWNSLGRLVAAADGPADVSALLPRRRRRIADML